MTLGSDSAVMRCHQARNGSLRAGLLRALAQRLQPLEALAVFVGQALSPSKVTSVTVTDLAARAARVVVPDYQLSLAIGREGQNARLAARLTGWRIDIRSDTAAQDDAPVADAGQA